MLDKSDYVKEINSIVGDRDTYTLLPSNPGGRSKTLLENIVQRGTSLGILNKKESYFLVPKAPRVPIIYYLPKIHKSLTCPPGFPIVSGIDPITSRVGKYMDFFYNHWFGPCPPLSKILCMLLTYYLT